MSGESEELEWSAFYDDEGQVYYYNSVTEETSWDAPAKFNPPQTEDSEVSTSKWERHKDDEGNAYYYNTETEETQWDKPEDFDGKDEEENKEEEEDDPDIADSPEKAEESTSKVEATSPMEENKEEEKTAHDNEGKWEKVKDDEGNTYYYNTQTEETQWDKPKGFQDEDEEDKEDDGNKTTEETSSSDEADKGKWEKVKDDEGNSYYYNAVTEETQWEKPEGFHDDDEEREDEKKEDEKDSESDGKEDDGELDDKERDGESNNKEKDGKSNNKEKDSESDNKEEDSESDDIENENELEADNKESKAKKGAWEEVKDDEGNTYYYNPVTEETQWDKPEGFQDSQDNDEKPKKRGDWEEVKDDEGNIYYYNTVTEETQWEEPEVFKEEVTNVEKDVAGKGDKDTVSEEKKAEVWEKIQDDEGREYYYNTVTEETQWDKPTDYVEQDVMVKKESSAPEKPEVPKSGSSGAWEKFLDDEGREYYFNAQTQDTQWDKPEGYVEPPADSVQVKSDQVSEWEALKDEEGREYYYNASTGETQWEKPEGFGKAAAREDTDEDEPASALSPERSPSPVVESADIKDEPMEEVEELKKSPEIDPVIKRVMDAENALQQPDAIMEPDCISNVLEVFEHKGPEKAILPVVDGFQGQTAICGLLGRWLVDLKSPVGVRDVPQGQADEIRNTIQDIISTITQERFSKSGGDSILNLSKSEAAFLEEMMDSNRWRKLLIDLSAKNKDSAVLMYCLRAISKRGHHREIAKRINQSDHFAVFNAMLQSELVVVGKVAISASSNAAGSIGLEELVKDLRRTCTATAYTYLYSIEVLRHLVRMARAEVKRSKNSRFSRAIRKWERLSQDLDCAMVDPSASSPSEGRTSLLFRKRRLDVALTISELHQRQRRRRKTSYGIEQVDSHEDKSSAKETGLLNFLRRYSMGTQVDDRILDVLLPTGLDLNAAGDVGNLLIAHPLAIRALIGYIFKSASTRLPPSTKSKCARLIALAVLAAEKEALAECSGADDDGEIIEMGESDEVSLTRMILQGSQLCKEVEIMASFLVTRDIKEKGPFTTPGHQLSALALKVPTVSHGVMMWAREIAERSDFVESATYPTFAPSLLSLVRVVCLRHPCTRVDATDIAFAFLSHSSTSEMSYKKMNAIKEQSLRLMLFLIVKGEASQVLRIFISHLKKGDAIKMDASLLRYFAGGLLQVINKPYSIPFMRLVGTLLMTSKYVDAVRTTYFGKEDSARLTNLLAAFKETLRDAKPPATAEDIRLLASLEAAYTKELP